MKIDWSGARVLATLAAAVAGFLIGANAEPIFAIVFAPFFAFGAWWMFPKIVKKV
jgi:hypothetical protein